jgi:hypothetical protein
MAEHLGNWCGGLGLGRKMATAYGPLRQRDATTSDNGNQRKKKTAMGKKSHMLLFL